MPVAPLAFRICGQPRLMSFIITQYSIFAYPDAITADQLFDQNLRLSSRLHRFHLTNHVNMLVQNASGDRAFIPALQERLHNLQYTQLRHPGIQTHSDFSC